LDALGFDATKVAGAYATFAGLLAGFVFAAMVYLMSSDSQRRRNLEAQGLDIPLSWSVLAFVSLSLGSFLFALLSGEDRFGTQASGAEALTPRIRPLMLFIIASGTLTTAILVLLLALIWLFKRDHINGILIGQLRFATYLSGLLTCYFLDGTFLAAPIVQRQIAVDDHSSTIPTLAIFGLAVVVGEVLGTIVRRAGAMATRIVRVATQYLLLVVVFACGALYNFLASADEAGSGAWNVRQYEWWGVGALGVVLCLCVTNLPSWRGGKG
jgi:hypothetical protein